MVGEDTTIVSNQYYSYISSDSSPKEPFKYRELSDEVPFHVHVQDDPLCIYRIVTSLNSDGVEAVSHLSMVHPVVEEIGKTTWKR